MARAKTEQAEEIRRHAHRTAGVSAECEIDEAAGYRNRRSARRAAGKPVRTDRIDEAIGNARSVLQG